MWKILFKWINNVFEIIWNNNFIYKYIILYSDKYIIIFNIKYIVLYNNKYVIIILK